MEKHVNIAEAEISGHALLRLLPHRPPMLLLDSIQKADLSDARGRLVLRDDNPFMDSQGRLEGLALAEIMAQCLAAAFGASASQDPEQEPAPGYLASLRDVEILGEAKLGDVLDIRAAITATLGGIHVAQGSVHCQGRLLAQGQFKVFCVEEKK